MKFVVCLLLALFSACTTSFVPRLEDRTVIWPIDKPNDCAVKLFQGGREVVPVVSDDMSTFELLPRKFRIEVTSNECQPTIALVHRNHLEYILRTPLVFSSSGVFMAGSPDQAYILTGAGISGSDPRISLSELLSRSGESVWIGHQYDELCEKLGYCPTPIMAYSTAWPFVDPVSKKKRNYAEFSRFRDFEAMSTASGETLQMVVYLNWKILSKKGFYGYSNYIYVLNPNVLVLNFK